MPRDEREGPDFTAHHTVRDFPGGYVQHGALHIQWVCDECPKTHELRIPAAQVAKLLERLEEVMPHLGIRRYGPPGTLPGE